MKQVKKIFSLLWEKLEYFLDVYLETLLKLWFLSLIILLSPLFLLLFVQALKALSGI